jgi:hypothetical protein
VDVYEALLTLTTVGAQDGFILDWMNVCKRTIISIHHQTLLLVLGLAKFRAVHVIHAGDSMYFFHRRGQSEALRKAAASAIGFDVSFDEVPGSVEQRLRVFPPKSSERRCRGDQHGLMMLSGG